MKRLPFVATAFLLVAAIFVAGCGAEKPKPTLKVTVEQKGKDLVVRMETTGVQIGKDAHAHIRLDGGPEVMPNTEVYTIPNVAPGKHKVFVELSDPSHKPLGVQQEVEVEMK